MRLRRGVHAPTMLLLVVQFARAPLTAAWVERAWTSGGNTYPWSPTETSEATSARVHWPNSSGMVEFVHVHKCGGKTFQDVAPGIVCAHKSCGGTRDCATRAFNHTECSTTLPCCMYDWAVDEKVDFYRTKFGAPPSLITSLEEKSAYKVPWVKGETFKAVMIRQPYDRWVSEQLNRCRDFDSQPVTIKEEHETKMPKYGQPHWSWVSAARNRIAESVIPEEILGNSKFLHREPSTVFTQPLQGERLEAARHALFAFAFVGITEQYERSVCLFAKTFAHNSTVVCEHCCQTKKKKKHDDNHTARLLASLPMVPRVNAARDTPHEKYSQCKEQYVVTDEERELYGSTHPLEMQIYEIALSAFRARWDLALDDWAPSGRDCGCSFDETRLTPKQPHARRRKLSADLGPTLGASLPSHAPRSAYLPRASFAVDVIVVLAILLLALYFYRAGISSSRGSSPGGGKIRIGPH